MSFAIRKLEVGWVSYEAANPSNSPRTAKTSTNITMVARVSMPSRGSYSQRYKRAYVFDSSNSIISIATILAVSAIGISC